MNELSEATSGGSEMDEYTYATLATSAGSFTITLFAKKTPKTVANFVGLAKGTQAWTDPRTGTTEAKKLFDGTHFHRIIAGFMIQGGATTPDGVGQPGYVFEDEFVPGLGFDRPYMAGMANFGPGTNGSQFFVTVAPVERLNGKHTIFGEVMDEESRSVVDRISNVTTNEMNRPLEAVTLNSVVIENSPKLTVARGSA
jgi:peptidyl-prolyl cis-trans isomerase A (cyclophilin A)